MYKLALEKAEELEIKLPALVGWQKKQERSKKKKKCTSALFTIPKALTVWITTNYGKFKRWEYQATWPASWEICIQVKKQQIELNMEKQIASKLGKEYVSAVFCDTAYLIYMQSKSLEMLDWMKHKLELRLPGKINNFRYTDDATLMAEKEELKSFLIKVKDKSEKFSLKLNI